MVKNVTGGNKGKQCARKGHNQGGTSDALRRAVGINEMYGVVTKIHSSRRCEIVGTDTKTYLCNIRKKFVKGKRTDTKIPVGVWVIVGFYEWEVRSEGIRTCEILEVYSAIERERIKQVDSIRVATILHIGENDVNTNIKFSGASFTEDVGNIENELNDEELLVQPEYNDLSDEEDDDLSDGNDDIEYKCDSSGNYIVKSEVEINNNIALIDSYKFDDFKNVNVLDM